MKQKDSQNRFIKWKAFRIFRELKPVSLIFWEVKLIFPTLLQNTTPTLTSQHHRLPLLLLGGRYSESCGYVRPLPRFILRILLWQHFITRRASSLCFSASFYCCWKCKVHMTYCTIIYSLFPSLKPPSPARSTSPTENLVIIKRNELRIIKKRPQFDVLSYQLNLPGLWGRPERTDGLLKIFWKMDLNKTYLIGRMKPWDLYLFHFIIFLQHFREENLRSRCYLLWQIH